MANETGIKEVEMQQPDPVCVEDTSEFEKKLRGIELRKATWTASPILIFWLLYVVYRFAVHFWR